MLLLLPPSEGKTAPGSGSPLELRSLQGPSLNAHRRLVLRSLIAVSRRPDAVDVLGVGRSLADEVARNRHLRTAPAAPAATVYTGVLYAAAGLDRLPDAVAERRAAESVLTVSALWGVVGPADLIPAYRLSMAVTLPGVGPLAASWRAPLRRALDRRAGAELVLDCRSAPYAAAWPGVRGGPGHVSVSVLREVDGRRTVVSHSAKHVRGLLTRHLLCRAGELPTSPAEACDTAGELVGPVLRDVGLRAGTSGRHVLELLTI